MNLIITDYCMPGMTGYDLLRKIKVRTKKALPFLNFSFYHFCLFLLSSLMFDPAFLMLCLPQSGSFSIPGKFRPLEEKKKGLSASID